MKKFFVSLVSVLCISLFSVPFVCNAESAEVSHVVDNADLFTDSEEQELETRIDKLRDNCKCEIVIYTDNESFYNTPEDFVEDFYFDNGYGYNGKEDGVVMFVNMDTRELSIQAFGKLNKLNDSKRENVYNDVVNELIFDDYYEGATDFLNDIPAYTEGRTYHKFKSIDFIIGIGIPAILFLAIFFGVKSKYASEGKEKPYPFREKANIKLNVKEDTFVREYTTHVTHTSSSGGGGGGSHSFSSSSGHSSSSRGHF